MAEESGKNEKAALYRALQMVTNAMDFIDGECDVPEAAVHLDLARHELTKALSD
ncbi:hypothetical protein H8M03_03990 [Sphingomonas sabuli]|uniref:Uncharacterized protein n=1 Tax=Sphingomonas sabuli TaxID=2764186 RepID=A0A7G9L4F2_9SPHN|nr:hypothetical protein [Sphingomonas sabuli]QNM83501.1 hypothetical protein H8M03_03990 [Sphingomonas sabuli]